MKKKLLWIIVYSFCIVSCTTDTATQNTDSKIRNVNNEFIPQSITNIYNAQAKEYYEIINLYRNKDGFPETVEELALQIKAIEDRIYKQELNNNLSITTTMVSDILKDPEGKLQKMIEGKHVSFTSQERLLKLISILKESSTYQQTNLHEIINAYELEVIQNEALNEEDKQAVLSFVSISQFLVSTESERKDRDWEKAVTNKREQNLIKERQVTIVTFIVLINNLISPY